MRIHSTCHLGLALTATTILLACSGSDTGSAGFGGATANSITVSGGKTGMGGATLAAGGASSASTNTSGGAGASNTSGTVAALGGITGAGGSVSQPGGGTSSPAVTTAKGGTSSSSSTTSTGGTTSAKGGTTSIGGTTATAKGGTTSAGGTASTVGTTGTGGTTSAGTTGACTPTWQTPPSNVSAWIDESWNSQLSNNIKTRQDWLLDSVMKGKGQVNLCVRWGATTAPTAAVKSGMAAAVQKWLNDWFTNLSGYGCFPYTTITTKVTGWAVKPGNIAWVSDLDSSIKIYTESDGDGEPKCADACSFFTNWSHTFPNCPGGEAFHHDYWLWLDDTIGGGAAAVGGDWGLRMPVSNFISSMNKSNLVIEHEMGHGFGFQDYYDWTGSTPTGGSLMIVGSTSSQVPTTADTWLLRRTWKEMKALRGW